MVWRIRVKDRALEWLFASFTLCYGAFLTAPWDALNPLTFAPLLALVPEQWWAWAFCCAGTGHMFALSINGARWWTPFIRAAAAGSAFVAYVLLSAGVYYSLPTSSAVPVYGYLAAGGSLIIFFRAVKDSVHAARARRRMDNDP